MIYYEYFNHLKLVVWTSFWWLALNSIVFWTSVGSIGFAYSPPKFRKQFETLWRLFLSPGLHGFKSYITLYSRTDGWYKIAHCSLEWIICILNVHFSAEKKTSKMHLIPSWPYKNGRYWTYCSNKCRNCKLIAPRNIRIPLPTSYSIPHL